MSAFTQYKAVLHKNFLISLRTKEYLRENISVVILGVFLVVVETTQPNNFISPFYMALAVAGYARTVALTWVNERQTRQKQLQKIMGISQFMYLLAWLTYYILNALLVSLVMMLIFRFGVMGDDFNFAQGYGFINIVVIYVIYAISIIGFVLLLSNFFSKAKTAAQGATFIQLVINFLYFLRFSDDIVQNHAIMSVLAVFPQMGFNLGVSSIAFIDQKSFPPPNFSYSDSLLSLSIGGIIFLALALYVDQVWPNQMGTNKHPLFFLNFLKRNTVRGKENPLLEEDEEENETSAKYEQGKSFKSESLISIKNLSKSFGEKEVIKNLKMKFYPSEIFCLLGHNGAGKSTTINLLTGLLRPNEGEIDILGLNYRQNLTQIRKNIGLCLQYNVLYDDLTIEDHLRFYAKIKGLPKQQIEENIEKTIDECALRGEAGKFAKNLSGGNKRKLCLANALIGNSKIIFLDEPSSGLDPNSRQGIWQIMKNIRSQNRCIILTTHHLEEAEELSQRIGIMAQGKLIIVGDCQYIKEKFSVGYHAILSFTGKGKKQQMNQCRKIIARHIPSARQDEQTAAKTLKFILPESEIGAFGKLFEELEQIATVSVKKSNLEDAFIKIGQSEDSTGNMPEIDNLVLPNVICSFSFAKQFKAVFAKKFFTTFRSLSTVVSVILPAVFILIGVVMVSLAIKGDDSQKEVLQWVKRYVMSYFMVWAFVFNTSSYCGSIVEERQKRFKYLSNVMGLRKIPYWLANYSLDFLIFIIPMIFFFALIYAFGQPAKFLTDVTKYLIPLLLLFGFSFISYSYFFSFVFQKSSTAYRFFPFLNLIFFYLIPQIPSFVQRDGILAQYIMPLISPFIAFSNSFFTDEFLAGFSPPDTFKSNSLVFNYAALAIQTMVFLSATLFIENLRFNLKDKQQIEEDMHEEEVPRRQSMGNYPIVIEHLYKKYPNGYTAIRDNSFSVQQGEIFGLLGPNGAGKSTTFNISTAALPKTSGVVRILGQGVDKGIMDIFQHVGVCPQYDALYDNFTTEEHLRYFARLKGLDEDDIDKTVAYYYELMSLTPYIKVKAGVLSGGNKRKLCVSMAMLANPSIMFFDEPSTGVDPISRRYLWKSLSLSVKNKRTAMVLTTHAMNEAQSLCSRIGILIKGKFVEVATPQQLKKKYGKGYRITVKRSLSNSEAVNKIIKDEFDQNVSVQEVAEEVDPETQVYIVEASAFSYSKAYNLCQILMQKSLIESYRINESTLQEVFLFLSQMQPPPVEEEYKEPWECLCWSWGMTGCSCLI